MANAVSWRCHQGGGQPGQDASDTADVPDGVHDDLLRLWMSSRRPYGGWPASRIGSDYPVFPRCSLYFRRAGQPEPGGVRRGDLTGRGIQFRQHGGDVMIDGLGGDEQLARRSPRWCARRRSGRAPHARAGSARADAPGSRSAARPGSTGCRAGASCCRVICAAAEAPRPVKIFSASRSAASSAASCRASAASYGQPRLGPQPGGLLPVACRLQPVGLGEVTARRPGRTGAPQPDSDRAALPAVAAWRRRHRPARLRVRPDPAGPPASTPRRGPAARA